MKSFPDKQQILELVIQRMAQSAAHATQHAQATREEATHAEAKPENDKDTRALEQTYLARGQAMRAEAITEQVQMLRFLPLNRYQDSDPISAGALVELEADDSSRLVFLLPHGGGIEVRVDGTDVHVITPSSPLGMAVLGRNEGDEFELRMRGVVKQYVINAVR